MNVIIVAVGILFFVPFSLCQRKIDVDIYYESLCPDSIAFINKQLYPAWNDIKDYVNLKFVPFGKSASLQDKESFVCQHGPNECMGNRIMSCALSGIEDLSTQVEFVNCFMANFKHGFKKGDVGQSCASRIALNWKYVTQCYNSNQGTQLQLRAEQETAQIKPSFVPTIVFNKRFDQEAQTDSQHSFLEVVCTYITQLHPQACLKRSVIHI